VEIGTRFPAPYTSQGKVLLAALTPDELADVLAQPSRSGLPRFLPRDPGAFGEELCAIRARGWALADEELAPGIRSVAAPVRDGTGTVRAAMNVTVHAAETTVERLTGEYLPLLLRTAGDVSADWALWQSRPYSEVPSAQDASSGGGRSSG
jgi:IclR family pca regulon transcriptional regulator